MCSIVALSLPIEYSITGLSHSATTSRMMRMLSASRRCRWVSFVSCVCIPATLPALDGSLVGDRTIFGAGQLMSCTGRRRGCGARHILLSSGDFRPGEQLSVEGLRPSADEMLKQV